MGDRGPSRPRTSHLSLGNQTTSSIMWPQSSTVHIILSPEFKDLVLERPKGMRLLQGKLMILYRGSRRVPLRGFQFYPWQ
jgi:hypothetical protein